MKKTRVLVAVVAAVGLLVGACSSDSDAPQETPAQSSADSSSSSAAEPDEGGSDDDGAQGESEAAEGGLSSNGVQYASQELLDAAKAEGSLVIYTSIAEARARGLADEFTAATGVPVELMNLTGSKLNERAESEFAAGKLGADLIHSGEYWDAVAQMAEGMYEPYCPEGVDRIPDDLQVENCDFTISHLTPYVIGYNTAIVSEADVPRSWADLLDPRWSNRQIGMAEIGTGGSTWSRDYFLKSEFGIEYWEKLAAQQPVIANGAAPVTESIARGEYPLGTVFIGNQSVSAQNGAPVNIVLPSDGVPAYIGTIAVTSVAAHPNAAKLYLNWLLTDEGQKAIAEKSGDFPPIPGIANAYFNGEELEPGKSVALVYSPLLPGYNENQEADSAQWYQIFGYTP